MSAHGAKEARWSRFRGVCTQTDPTELPPGLMADCLDVDWDGDQAVRRLGVQRYNSGSALPSTIDGLSSLDGALLVAAGTKVYRDNGTDGSFTGDEIATGLTGGSPMDFWTWRGTNLYFGNGVDSVYKWTSGTAAVLAPITAPAAAPTVAPTVLQAEAFDSGAWTSTNAALTSAYDTTIRREGTGCLKLTISGSGALNAYVYRALSAGATVDLSEVDRLVLWVQGNLTGLQFQVALYDDTQTTLSSGPTWDRFPTFTLKSAGVWQRIEIPLAAIKPSDRDAVPGIAIKFISEGGRGYTTNPLLYFDDAKGLGLMTPDHYEYRYTYATVDSSNNVLRESAPSAAAQLDLSHDTPYKGTSITVTASGDGTVNQIRVYRYRRDGFWAGAKLVKTASNANATLTDAKDDGQVDLDPASVRLQLYRDAPPKAYTYCLSGNRLYCGDVTVGGTRYRNRVYVSAYNDPETFSPSEHLSVTDPTAAGWFDLPKGHNIRRLVDFDGRLIIFTDRSIYSLEGDGWDNFTRPLRADVGLDARWAVAVTDRLIYFLSADGVRVLAPNASFDGAFPCWRIDEPVADLIGGIPTIAFFGRRRTKVAFGVDERGRLHIAYTSGGNAVNNAGLVFDPRIAGALDPGQNPYRPGWTRYSNWKYSLFHRMPQWRDTERVLLIAAEDNDNYVVSIFYKYATATGGLAAISDTSLAWSITGPGVDASLDRRVEVVYLAAELYDAANTAAGTATAAVVKERGASTTSGKTLAATTRGAFVRFGATVNPRIAQAKVYSSGADTADRVRSFALGYYVR